MTVGNQVQGLYYGRAVDRGPSSFGELRSSSDLLDDVGALRARMAEDGYLFMPGLLNRDDVLAGRRALLGILLAEGSLSPTAPFEDGVAAPGVVLGYREHISRNPPGDVRRVLFTGAMIGFFERFLGGEIRHFDFTWVRTKSPEGDSVTPPHTDIVYMGRGTPRVHTAWVPFGDVPVELGGLMVLEGSHTKREQLKEYWATDVDEYCKNGPEAERIESGLIQWESTKKSGAIDIDAFRLQDRLGGRWLTTDFKAGDALIFGMFTVHASLDNQTRRFRISTDSRYQLASEEPDPRWVGANPVGHGLAAKRPLVC